MNLTKKVFFLHIPKTGGEFINNLLRKLVPDDQYLEHLQNYVHLEDNSFLDKRFLSGHIPLKRFQKIADDLEDRLIFTIIREPYNHLISHISWVRNLTQNSKRFNAHPKIVQDLAIKLEQINFENAHEVEEFVHQIDGYALAAFDNRQIRYFVDPPDTEWTNSNQKSEAIKMAKQLSFVGLFEDFENSVKGILKTLGTYENITLEMEPINSKNKKVILDIYNKPKIKKILYPLVCHDLELYKTFLLV